MRGGLGGVGGVLDIVHGLSRMTIDPRIPTRGGGGGGVLIGMHGRSRMGINPRIPTMPERSTPGFHRLGRHCLLACTKLEAP